MSGSSSSGCKSPRYASWRPDGLRGIRPIAVTRPWDHSDTFQSSSRQLKRTMASAGLGMGLAKDPINRTTTRPDLQQFYSCATYTGRYAFHGAAYRDDIWVLYRNVYTYVVMTRIHVAQLCMEALSDAELGRMLLLAAASMDIMSVNRVFA